MFYSHHTLLKNARLLITLAWTVEVIAVLIGLTISIVVAVSAYSSFASEGDVGLLEGSSSILVAALPFVLIAVVEICKIPLTFAFMAVRNRLWRGMFLTFVLFLCLITFETMLNGFERNFSNLNRAIDTRKNNIESAEQAVGLLENRRAYVVKFTEEDLITELDAEQVIIDGQFNDAAVKIDRNTREVLSNIDYGFQDELTEEIARLELVRDKYYDDWREETEAVEERFSTLLLQNIGGSASERDRLLAELDTLKREFDQAMATANFFNRSQREQKYRGLIREKEQQLSVITTGYLGGDALEKQSTMEAQLKQQMDFVNSKYTRRIDEIDTRVAELKTEIETRLAANAELETSVVSKASSDKARFARIRAEQITELKAYEEGKRAELEIIAERAFTIDEEIFTLRNEQRSLQSEINHLINQNQIYRLAMYFTGKESATDVERRSVGVVALLWFGSLSLIAAVCGVMLALAGFYLRRAVESGEE